MHNRIKQVRVINGLSQDAFGEQIGIKRSSVSLLESGRNTPSNQTILSICRAFNISERWLRTGEGDMLLPKPQDAIDRVAMEFNLSELERRFLVAYMALPETVRKAFVDGMYDNLFREKENPAQDESEAGATDFLLGSVAYHGNPPEVTRVPMADAVKADREATELDAADSDEL